MTETWPGLFVSKQGHSKQKNNQGKGPEAEELSCLRTARRYETGWVEGEWLELTSGGQTVARRGGHGEHLNLIPRGRFLSSGVACFQYSSVSDPPLEYGTPPGPGPGQCTHYPP